MKLLVGLGNPGTRYAGNRHNVGFMALERIAEEHALSSWRRRFQAETLDARIGSERVLLLKPQTFMNESGRAVGEAARFLKIDPEDVIVFYDEIDLAPGKLKVKTGGGNAGHNGLRSISSHLGNDYVRVRIGVGHPGRKDQVANYVLNNFAKAEYDWLDPLLDAIARATPNLLDNDAARFTADVALKLGGQALDKNAKNDKGDAKKASRSQSKPKKAGAKKTSAAKPSHPAGERAQKRKSALAENLQKWLAGQGDKKE